MKKRAGHAHSQGGGNSLKWKFGQDGVVRSKTKAMVLDKQGDGKWHPCKASLARITRSIYPALTHFDDLDCMHVGICDRVILNAIVPYALFKREGAGTNIQVTNINIDTLHDRCDAFLTSHSSGCSQIDRGQIDDMVKPIGTETDVDSGAAGLKRQRSESERKTFNMVTQQHIK